MSGPRNNEYRANITFFLPSLDFLMRRSDLARRVKGRKGKGSSSNPVTIATDNTATTQGTRQGNSGGTLRPLLSGDVASTASDANSVAQTGQQIDSGAPGKENRPRRNRRSYVDYYEY